MKTMHTIKLMLQTPLLAFALLCSLAVSAQTVTTTTNFSPGAYIPDASAAGLADTRIINTPITFVTGLKVTLKISGTFDGDLYCWLGHSTRRTVLLNRVARRSSSSLGYGDPGFNVTFDDAATNGDVHVYRLTLNGNHSPPLPGPLTNSWAPAARTNSRFSVLDTNARSAFLSSFNGLDPNGEWVLFVADVEGGDIHTLDNWGLQITGYVAPSIAAQPANQSIECSTGSATFSVSAGGTAPLAYQWWFNGAPISGQTNADLTLTNSTFASAGNYDVIITNSYGSVTSSVVTLTVVDSTAPLADVTSLPDVTGQCSATVTAPTAHDACDGLITATTTDQLSYTAQGDYTVHCNYSDSTGN